MSSVVVVFGEGGFLTMHGCLFYVLLLIIVSG